MVIGLSLGDVCALKAGQELEINGVVAVSVPIHWEGFFLQNRIFHYTKRYKQFEGKNEEQIYLEMKDFQSLFIDSFSVLQQYF